ncbi:DMT family transporter [Bartonella sp. HY329]|uniref:DMT family transporter n=1 Tax=unclassified Bartonella TaxID=2645622 RepID=UPI0021CAD6E6|nr:MULTISPECIES: DMT family transporter [unclassified Bartonella]UXM95484.1 DMT family transporter [Bartonella sp. HY329]UXN09810.1 DMT family transporter [Bartonella sp. HY328]
MSDASIDITNVSPTVTKTKQSNGYLNGFLGVAIFAGSLPATRIGVLDMNPYFLTTARATIAGICAILVVYLLKAKLPQKHDIFSLILTALGIVVGFPLFTALALQHITSAHSLVFTALLPLMTAIFAVLRAGERPKPLFWFFAIIGSLCIVAYSLLQGFSAAPMGDIYMLLAIISAGLGYAEGAKLSRRLGGPLVISYALIVSLPLMIILSIAFWPSDISAISINGWLALAYVSLFSMFIGFFFWYKGLAEGGIAKIGQLQLLQPFMGMILSAVILHEHVDLMMIIVSLGVIGCVFGARRFA